MRPLKIGAALVASPFVAMVVVVYFTSGCTSEDCFDLPCGDLTDNPMSDTTLSMCDRGDGYIRLDDAEGEEIYECYCDQDTMKLAAKRICEEGVACRRAGSSCSSIGDCCAGLGCNGGTCG